MPATYEPIASTTLGSDSASVTFSDIPGTYTDLVVVCFVRSTATGITTGSLGLRFNGDTGSNYSYTYLLGDGSAASSARGSSATEAYPGEAAGADYSRNPVIFHVMSYSNTNVNKTVLGSGDNPAWGVSRTVSLWRSTAAVTSLTVRRFGGGNNLASGSTFSLYGIKAA